MIHDDSCLDMHGLIFETSIFHWQDQPGNYGRLKSHYRGAVASAAQTALCEPLGEIVKNLPKKSRYRGHTKPRARRRSTPEAHAKHHTHTQLMTFSISEQLSLFTWHQLRNDFSSTAIVEKKSQPMRFSKIESKRARTRAPCWHKRTKRQTYTHSMTFATGASLN